MILICDVFTTQVTKWLVNSLRFMGCNGKVVYPSDTSILPFFPDMSLSKVVFPKDSSRQCRDCRDRVGHCTGSKEINH